ncbi:DUF4189 domain-containing protein [Microcoleus sp.]|uniref:DUF4189 domain-containing protein n=1 Tax=Microcoleus sp. TaxID=44472 RepID=UPI00403E44A4
MQAGTTAKVINRASVLQKLLQVLFIFIVFTGGIYYNTFPALAWKPTTHVYLADRVLEDARDGNVIINRVNAETGEVIGQIKEYPVAPEILSALRSFPAQYRAGVLGPDAYPDILTGQQVIHPGTGSNTSNRWLEYLWEHSNESPAIKAFVIGYLTHAAGDMYGHTFVNRFTDGAFEVKPPRGPENAIKHILLEEYVNKRAPSPIYDASIAGVEDFIYRYMVDAKPGSVLDRELLRQGEEGTNFSVPRIYSTLRAKLQRDIDDYFARKADYDRRYDDKVQAAQKCKLLDFGCSRTVLYAQAAAIQAEKGTYVLQNGLTVTYKEYWRNDIDRGLKAWPKVSHDVALALFFNPEQPKFEQAEAVLKDYVNKYLISMSGAPDVVGDLAAIANKITDIISQVTPDFLVTPIRELKNNIYDAVVVRATGMTREQLKQYLSSPATYFDRVMTQGAGENIDRQTFDTKYLRLNIDKTDKFDYQKFTAAYNTVTMSKLLLLSKEGINQLLADLGDSSRLDKPNIMLGFIKTLDGDNEQRKMVLAQNCSTYRQIFMKQAGEVFCDSVTRVSGDRFGAIAYSFSTGNWGYSYNRPTEGDAQSVALNGCKNVSGASDCEIKVELKNNCGVMAANPDNSAAGWAYAGSRREAERVALEKCNKYGNGCRPIVWACTGVDDSLTK